MKVLLVSDAGSIHTKRWASSLKDAGVDIVLFSITPADEGFYSQKDIRLYVFDLFSYKNRKDRGGKKKVIPLFAPLAAHADAVRLLKKVLQEEKPDILHAHYATSYGLVAALSGYHPFVLSVWGSDVYEFPEQSFVNRTAVKYMLGKADRVLSTSRAMAVRTSLYYKGDIGITPFGVDIARFRKELPAVADNRRIVFGTVKTLSQKYGIDLLIRAFARMRLIMSEKYGSEAPETVLEIAGKGPDRRTLGQLASDLGVAANVDFLGEVGHDSVPDLYSGMDVAVFLSRSESFGVSAVEAMSCSVPVIASDAAGFMEVLEDGAGVIVPCGDVESAAEAMARLATDAGERMSLAVKGRRRVEERYDWKKNVETMIKEYGNVLLHKD